MNHENAVWPIAVWFLQLIALLPVSILLLANLWASQKLDPMAIATLIVSFYVGLVTIVALTKRGRTWIRSHRFQLTAAAGTAILTYVVCEVVLTGATMVGIRLPRFDEESSIWLFENSQKTVHFDPIRGFRLCSESSRSARITYGTIEYVSEFRGNNMGFPDRDDFGPTRSEPDAIRLAVFGDSFTAATFLESNWPDYIEHQLQHSVQPMRLLNFSVSGGGLANWWSVLTKIVEKEKYDLDGVVFAVYADDLRRRFCVAEHRGYDRHMFGRARTWNPDYFPKTDEEAKLCLKTLGGYIVNKDQFDAAIRGDWTPSSAKGGASLAPYLARNVVYGFGKMWNEIPSAASRSTEGRPDEINTVLESDRMEMIEDLRRSLRAIGLPVLVVFVPRRLELLEYGDQLQVPAEIQEFARFINAKLINGSDAFDGMTRSEIRSAWFPYDGHWAQGGSDRFAQFMAEQLQNWIESEDK